jgi:hypothetical protein
MGRPEKSKIRQFGNFALEEWQDRQGASKYA